MTKQNKNKFSSKFRNRILMYFMPLFLLVIAAISVVYFVTTQSLVRATAADFSEQIVTQVDQAMTDYVAGVEHLNKVIEASANAVNFLNGLGISSDKQKLQQLLEHIKITRSDVLNVHLIKAPVSGSFSDIDIVSSAEGDLNENIDYSKATWYNKYIDASNKKINTFMTPSYVQNIIAGQYDWVVSVGCLYQVDNKYVGMFLIDLKYDSIIDICTNIMPDENGYIYLLNHENEIMYHPKQRYIYSGLFEEDFSVISQDREDTTIVKGDSIYSVVNSQTTEWITVGVVKISFFNLYLGALPGIFLLVSFIFLILVVLIAYVLSKRISKPIIQLQSAVTQLSSGDLTVQTPIDSGDEIGALSNSFNTMVKQIDQLMTDRLEDEKHKQESEMNVLRAQINPHFLYNTLDSIIWMSELGNNGDVVEMTSALAKMMRASISQSSKYATIKTEFEHIASYLKIQKYRHSTKLAYEINVSNDLNDVKMEHLTLQPIVENAIIHGFRKKTTGGVISITATLNELMDTVKIEVCDNGDGMDDVTRVQILKENTEDKEFSGLRNVNSRIKLRFGEDYGLSIQSTIGEGTKVTMIVPYKLNIINQNEVIKITSNHNLRDKTNK